jgi:hypothetical protein
MNKTRLCVVIAALMACAPAYAGEDLLLLAPGKPLSATGEEKPKYSVNVVKLTLPPLTQPERGIHIEQTFPDMKPAAKMPLARNAVFHSSLPRDAATRKALAPIPALAAPENLVAALPPLDVLTEIPGCITPEDVAVDKRIQPYTAAAPGSRDNLLDLPAMDAFPALNLPVASTGISPALPAMPVYRDAAVETLEPFTPEPARKKRPPEQLRLPLPLASDRSPVVALPLTASAPPGGVYAPGSALLVAPLGMSLTATMPPMEQRPPPPMRKPPRKQAPSLAERSVPEVGAGGEDGFTPVRGIRNLLGQKNY